MRQLPPVRFVRRFLEVEAAGGLLLVGAVAIAIGWASSPWSASYHDLWDGDARHWVNDGLMALFFLVIGLEVKRELVVGQLADRRAALLPVAGALGGMVLPAALFFAVNAAGPGARGWAIPMATDVAFAVGALALVGRRAPRELTTMLLALAIVDDIGAVVVIALFYGDGIEPRWLALAGAGLLAIAAMRRSGRWSTAVYVALGVGVWAATLESGVHATLAGVAVALLAPVSAAERLERALHPWTAFAIVPLFALANAGVTITADGLAHAATSRITIGVVAGLVIGKAVGIAGAIRLATRLGVATLPLGVTRRHVAGMAALSGIGFTVSLFITGLAYDDPSRVEQATLGILAASLVAAGLGTAILRRSDD